MTKPKAKAKTTPKIATSELQKERAKFQGEVDVLEQKLLVRRAIVKTLDDMLADKAKTKPQE